MKILYTLFLLSSFFTVPVDPLIYTDSGCICALAKSSTITPNAGTSISVGCSIKTDWTGATTEWCLTDESAGQCGTLQASFGYLDSCASAGFPEVHVQPAPQIEWNQPSFTYYTGQSINITWTTQNIGSDEWIKITYPGAGGTRTLTTGSGTNVTAGSYKLRLSESANGLATNVPITVSAASWSTITNTSMELFTLLQSKVQDVFVYDGTRTLVTGQTALCDNRNVTVVWRGLGQAQFGTATVTLKSSFGGGTTVGTAVSGLVAAGNMTVNYTLPRSFTPSGFTTYSAQISVQEPGQTAYTGSSSTFSLAAGASVTPSPSQTPTSSKTPSPSPSSTPSPSQTASPTPSQTPTSSLTPSVTASQTPTNSPTPSVSPSPAASLDIAAISRAAASAVDVNGPVIGGIVGTLGVVGVLLVAYRFYMHKRRTELREKKLKMSARFVEQRNAMYGIEGSGYTNTNEDHNPHLPNMVMYTLNVGGLRANALATKRAFPPVNSSQKSSV